MIALGSTTPTAAATLVLLALAMLAHVSEIECTAQRCFVCAPHAGGSTDDLREIFPGEALTGCEHFDVDDVRFARACPTEYKGCLTVTNGTQVTRTCSFHAVDDCKIANGIKYCYCGQPLCNRAPAEPMATRGGAPIDDDEDLTPAEGSGAGSASGTFRHRETTTTPTSRAAHVTPAAAPPHAQSRADGVVVVQRTNLSRVVGVLVIAAALAAIV